VNIGGDYERLVVLSVRVSVDPSFRVCVYTMTRHVSYTTGRNCGAVLWKLLHSRRYALSRAPSSSDYYYSNQCSRVLFQIHELILFIG